MGSERTGSRRGIGGIGRALAAIFVGALLVIGALIVVPLALLGQRDADSPLRYDGDARYSALWHSFLDVRDHAFAPGAGGQQEFVRAMPVEPWTGDADPTELGLADGAVLVLDVAERPDLVEFTAVGASGQGGAWPWEPAALVTCVRISASFAGGLHVGSEARDVACDPRVAEALGRTEVVPFSMLGG